MNALTALLYIAAFGLWLFLIRRDGGIGVGFRFLFGLNLALFFLIGPLVGEVFSSGERRFASPAYELSVQLSLYAFGAYLLGSYLVFPLLIGRPVLIPAGFADRMAAPARLAAQRKVAWALVAIGIASLPFFTLLYGIATVRAVVSQVPLLTDTGLVMLCLYASAARRLGAWAAAIAVLVGKGVIFSAISGHAGTVFLDAIFMTAVAFISMRFRFTALAALCLVGIIMFLPAQRWLTGRTQLRSAIQTGAGFEERMEIAVGIFVNPRPTAVSEQDLAAAYRDRADYSDLLAAAIAYTPSVQPFAMGATYGDVFIAVIPRFLWPNKPFVAGGNQFVGRYTGIRFGDETSVGMNYLFEMYINFGTVGAVIGMFLLGLLLGWMERLYYRKAGRNLFYEYCLILCSFFVSVACDKMADLAMTIPPALALCVLTNMALRTQIHSPYLPRLGIRRASTRPQALPGKSIPVPTDAA